MKYISTNGSGPAVGFREALFTGLAPDGGLYVPASMPAPGAPLRPSSLVDACIRTAGPFADEIPAADLASIAAAALSFPVPLVQLEEDLYLLELFHGPTFAFKDVGARFMALCLSYFLAQEQRNVTLLVATSGDTGSAVAHGFAGVPRIDVFVLYPSGKISTLQEHQMTTLGGNIHALEVGGTFDDCQALVKKALTDRALSAHRMVTTANSINIGRLIPQMAYYAWGVRQLQDRTAMAPLVVVPSGNFGNLTAAVYARAMGVAIRGFAAATNANDIVPEYFRSGSYAPRSSVRTLSNAMDVGDPSNFARLRHQYGDSLSHMHAEIDAVAIDDVATLEEIRTTSASRGYLMDPHTAVGVAAARRLRRPGVPVIVPATAHPAKFPDVVRRATGNDPDMPEALRTVLSRRKMSVQIPARYESFRELLPA